VVPYEDREANETHVLLELQPQLGHGQTLSHPRLISGQVSGGQTALQGPLTFRPHPRSTESVWVLAATLTWRAMKT
jgi:hypothetical protein